jgi:hypothetical protein
MRKVNSLAQQVKTEASSLTKMMGSFEGRATKEEKAAWKVILKKW